jgi:hypothetical protein
MKKLFVLAALLATVFTTEASAQQRGGGDPAAMMQRMKERVRPDLMEKAKLNATQADKAIETWFTAQRKHRDLRTNESLSQEDRAKQGAAIDETRDRELKAIPLTDDQVRDVIIFFEEMRKRQMQERRDNG